MTKTLSSQNHIPHIEPKSTYSTLLQLNLARGWYIKMLLKTKKKPLAKQVFYENIWQKDTA